MLSLEAVIISIHLKELFLGTDWNACSRIQVYHREGARFGRENMHKIRKIFASHSKLTVLTLTHFINDIHGSFLPTFIPLIVERLGISYAQAGLLRSLSGVIHMIIQPMAGYISDLFTRPYALMAGPILTALGASLLPASPTYGLAFLFVGLWGFGSAVYHPSGHGGVGYVEDPAKLAFFLAIFAVGGIFGATVSPLYAIALYRVFGSAFMPLAALVPVFLTGYLTWRVIPSIKEKAHDARLSPLDFVKTMAGTFRIIYPIWTVAVCRDTAVSGVRFFLPLLITSRGGTIVNVGTILFTINIIGAVSPILGGHIADGIGRKKVIAFGMIAAPFFLVPAALTRGILSIALYMAGNALLQALLPVTGAAAQEMAPRSRSVVASLVTGFAFGLAGLLLAPIGLFADLFGLVATLVFVALIPLLPMPLYFRKWRSMEDHHHNG
jgi:FSR family fosmidomycin resistance protein-like MFS transporter